MKLKEIAIRIKAHLQRFEADPVINARCATWKTLSYWHVNAYDAGARVMVSYVSFQGNSSLTKSEAAAYLEWLDAGNVGTHYKFKNELKSAPAERTAR